MMIMMMMMIIIIINKILLIVDAKGIIFTNEHKVKTIDQNSNHIIFICAVARDGHHTTDTTQLNGIAATNRQHHVGFQVYCNLNYSIHTLTKKVNI